MNLLHLTAIFMCVFMTSIKAQSPVEEDGLPVIGTLGGNVLMATDDEDFVEGSGDEATTMTAIVEKIIEQTTAEPPIIVTLPSTEAPGTQEPLVPEADREEEEKEKMSHSARQSRLALYIVIGVIVIIVTLAIFFVVIFMCRSKRRRSSDPSSHIVRQQEQPMLKPKV